MSEFDMFKAWYRGEVVISDEAELSFYQRVLTWISVNEIDPKEVTVEFTGMNNDN